MEAEPLSLKVMRLRRPHAEQPAPALQGEPAQRLLLPMSLTQTLAGESFKGYIHLMNNSAVPVRNAIVRIELTINNVKTVLFHNASTPISSIEPGGYFDADVEHALKQEGLYVLSCNVSYVLGGGEQTFKRSYKFKADPPFNVKQRVVEVDRQFLVECVVENATEGNICLTAAALQCPEGLQAETIGAAAGELAAVAAGGGPLRPKGSQGLLFSVKPVGVDVSAVTLLGTLALSWHVPDGPSGCALAHEVKIRACAVPVLELRITECPRQVKVEEPFAMDVEVINHGQPAEPSLVMDLRLMGAVKIHGLTRVPLGRLESHGRILQRLQLVVMVPGLHPLQGVSLEDVSGSRYDCGKLCDILAF